MLDGTCPELLQDLLELRGLGVLNIRQMFGDTAVKRNKYLRLIVHLTRPHLEPQPGAGDGMQRLTGDLGARRVLDLDVPMITLPVMPGRNLAVLAEAATRMHLLRARAWTRRPRSWPGTAISSNDRNEPRRRAANGDRQRHVRLGKSVVLNTLEDVGFFCVDNLPAELLPDFVRSVAGDDGAPRKLAVGIDVRNRHSDLANIPAWIAEVGKLGLDPKLLFLDAGDDALLKRYADTRRRHPLSHIGLSLADAIALERQVLKPLRALADSVIDTTSLNVHQLRRQVITGFALGDEGSASLLFESFAYRRGVPADADFVFDARVLPNPHWNPELRPLSGRDAPVREFLDAQEDVARYVEQVGGFLDAWLPRLPHRAQLHHRRVRLHRRPPSFGLPRGAFARAFPRRRLGRRRGAPPRSGLIAVSFSRSREKVPKRMRVVRFSRCHPHPNPLRQREGATNASDRHRPLLSWRHGRRHPARHP